MDTSEKRAHTRRYDQRRRQSQPWRHLYKTARWQRIRQQQLQSHPLCAWHLKSGRLVPATVVHHVHRHEGNAALFFGGPFESLCKFCHDSLAQQEERIGFSPEIGADGWPVDPRHPGASGGEGVGQKSGAERRGPAPSLKFTKNQIKRREG